MSLGDEKRYVAITFGAFGLAGVLRGGLGRWVPLGELGAFRCSVVPGDLGVITCLVAAWMLLAWGAGWFVGLGSGRGGFPLSHFRQLGLRYSHWGWVLALRHGLSSS